MPPPHPTARALLPASLPASPWLPGHTPVSADGAGRGVAAPRGKQADSSGRLPLERSAAVRFWGGASPDRPKHPLPTSIRLPGRRRSSQPAKEGGRGGGHARRHPVASSPLPGLGSRQAAGRVPVAPPPPLESLLTPSPVQRRRVLCNPMYYLETELPSSVPAF
nr:WAS/WASL-interacting protein family member 1-like isoform X2 [Zootoca vivipara]